MVEPFSSPLVDFAALTFGSKSVLFSRLIFVSIDLEDPNDLQLKIGVKKLTSKLR